MVVTTGAGPISTEVVADVIGGELVIGGCAVVASGDCAVVAIGDCAVVAIGGDVVVRTGVVETGACAVVDVVVVVEPFCGSVGGQTGSDVATGGTGRVGTGSVAAIGIDTTPSSPATAAATSIVRESFLMITSSGRHIPGGPVECAPTRGPRTRVANYSFPLSAHAEPR
ncbi:hypothetical protein [Nocardia asiatica]|uniref:hypothetical protein n=1 Tax=Nocardia asiatica TaxID=209252 RepID=UPI002454FAE6|nr:hypothetical protein [Nocardia asiatica]